MTEKMRLRLIGLLVIVAIMAIIIPLLISKPQQQNSSVPYVIPSAGLSNDTQHNAAEVSADQAPVAQVEVYSLNTGNTSANDTAKAVNKKVTVSQAGPHVLITTPQVKSKVTAKNSIKRQPKHSSVRHRSMSVIASTLADPLATVKAWVVQVASFNKVRYAQQLAAKLRRHHFDAYYRNSSRDSVARVYVGPVIDYKVILKLQTQLKKRYHLHGLIKKYRI